MCEASLPHLAGSALHIFTWFYTHARGEDQRWVPSTLVPSVWAHVGTSEQACGRGTTPCLGGCTAQGLTLCSTDTAKCRAPSLSCNLKWHRKAPCLIPRCLMGLHGGKSMPLVVEHRCFLTASAPINHDRLLLSHSLSRWQHAVPCLISSCTEEKSRLFSALNSISAW